MGSSTAYWYIQNKVIFVHNVGDLKANDFRSVDKAITELLIEASNSGATEVQVIVDNEDMTSLPSILELEGGRILKYFSQSNCGLTLVVINQSMPFLVVLSRLLTTVMGNQLLLANSLDEVTTQLKQLLPESTELPDFATWKAETIITTE